MKLFEYLNINDLMQEIEDGWVNVSQHPALPLKLLSYSKKTVFDNHWSDITRKCRGLIVSCGVDFNDAEIVARPFEKFFNINTEEFPETCFAQLPNTVPVIQEKLDGSLGIFWKYGVHWGIASKGSLNSDHSRWATDWMERHIEEHGRLVWPSGYTPVFEMICESIQHHVVSYNSYENLVLIALINNETGEELSPSQLVYYSNINLLERAEYHTKTVEQVLTEDRDNAEGYVLSYPRLGQPPLKLKIKHATFLKYQKILHSVSPKNVFELIRTGDSDTLNQWLDTVPEHVRQLIVTWKEAYSTEYQRIFNVCQQLMKTGMTLWTTRKEWAAWLLSDEYRKQYSSVCFAILDQKKSQPIIWKMVERNVKITSMIEED